MKGFEGLKVALFHDWLLTESVLQWLGSLFPEAANYTRLWDLQEEYLGKASQALLPPLLRWLQKEDLKATADVTHFIANSKYVAQRIQRVYGRDGEVVYPRVDLERFSAVESQPGEYYVAGGRLVKFEWSDLAIQAANEMGLPLKVFADGSERKRLEKMAGPTVEFLGWLDPDELAQVIAQCHALLFPGIEDFGILPVEVMAVGKPVIGVGEGGLVETVVEGVTGVLVKEASVEGLWGGTRRGEEGA